MQPFDHAQEALQRLTKPGAFLTVRHGDLMNTMTIGWGTIGQQWSLPVFQVLVRRSRYTWELIEKAHQFSVSIPANDTLNHALTICGTKSGRDIDKFQTCGLDLQEPQKIETPVIRHGGYTYECRILYKTHLAPNAIHEKIINTLYLNNDYHTIYTGEIVASYIAE